MTDHDVAIGDDRVHATDRMLPVGLGQVTVEDGVGQVPASPQQGGIDLGGVRNVPAEWGTGVAGELMHLHRRQR